jgi:hypothetical protein
MSRIIRPITRHITIITGEDRVLGNFIQITDSRFAGTADDPQGEGYVYDGDQDTGVMTNLIGIEPINLTSIELDKLPVSDIVALTTAFASKYEGQPKPN